ncbi:MAG: cation:proton antiporter [Actinobacteria bacterium]|nr:cation:proton antiporter [Actinomycetota bacterium]
MTLVFAFGVVLLVAVLVSGLAHRSVLSTTVMFLFAGTGLGSLGFRVVDLNVRQPVVRDFAVLALFSVLFTDALRIDATQLRRAWRLPARALLVGMPLTFGLLTLLARALVGLPWGQALLVAAVLSPTDPVFAAAIVGRSEIPHRLRHLLNVESGLNDGLALPVVIVLLAVVDRQAVHVQHLAGELALGVALGFVIPWVAIALERQRWFGSTVKYEPLNAFAIATIVFAASSLTSANSFLAAFTAGITVATFSPAVRDSFREFGELLSELLKLAAVMIFGAVLTTRMISAVPIGGFVFAIAALVLARPAGLQVALVGSQLDWRERAAASWFGPKGFASVVYGLLILESGTPRSNQLFALIAAVIALSIIAHSSTDVLVAHWFARAESGAVSEGNG